MRTASSSITSASYADARAASSPSSSRSSPPPTGGLRAARGGSALRRGDRRERLQHPQHNSTRGSYPVGLRVTERRSGGERRRRSGRARPHPGAARGGCASACRGGMRGVFTFPTSREVMPAPLAVGGVKRRTDHSRLPQGGQQSRGQPARAHPQMLGGSRGDR